MIAVRGLSAVPTLVVASLVALIAARPAWGQAAPDSTATLVGEVQGAMSGDPVIGAIVFLRIAELGAVTDSAGRFEIDAIPPGRDTLVIRYPGLDVQSTVLKFEPTTVNRATFLLAERVFQVADLTVAVRRPTVDQQTLARRMRTGQGVFIDRELMLERATDRPSDALRGISRVEVSVYGIGGQVVLFGYGTLACRPVYLVDGTRMQDDFELDDLRIDDIEMIELYRSPSEVPTQYRHDTKRCGLINVRIRGGRELGG